MELLIADDFLYPYGSGQLLTKQRYIELLMTGEIMVTERGPLDLSVRNYGDTAISYGWDDPALFRQKADHAAAFGDL